MILATLRRRVVGALTCMMLAASPAIAVERVYYVAAEEVAWDYAPSGRDLMMDMAFDEDQQVFVASSTEAIGRVYKKAIYRAYTDASFSTRLERGAEWRHLGLLGPILRAEVGDTMTQGAIGVMIGLTNAKFGMTTEPVWTAMVSSVKTIWAVLSFTWSGISDGITTRTNPGIAGPVGIAQATGEIVEEGGFSQVYQMAAILSISLGVLNMLPIPALDGGRFLFVVIEWLRRGKRVSPKKEGLVHLVGFAVLIGLILVITFFDISKIISGESFLR